MQKSWRINITIILISITLIIFIVGCSKLHTPELPSRTQQDIINIVNETLFPNTKQIKLFSPQNDEEVLPTPSFTWDSTDCDFVYLGIFKEKIQLDPFTNTIKNITANIWAWHSGLSTGGKGHIFFSDGKNITNNKLDIYNEPTPLDIGNYYWAIWAWNEHGQIITHSSKENFFAVRKEFKINTYTDNDQNCPSITHLNNGNMVVVWGSSGQDGSDDGVFGQILDSLGNKIGKEFQINTHIEMLQNYPSITSLTNNRFIVTWTSYYQDGSDSGIYGQIFDNQGNKIGNEFLVNTHTEDGQYESSVTGLKNGGFVVTWTSYKDRYVISGQIYDPYGSKYNQEFTVNTSPINSNNNPSISALNDDGFVIAWSCYEQSIQQKNIYAQIYDKFGNKKGDTLNVSAYSKDYQYDTQTATLSQGGFVVIWTGKGITDYEIFGQLFDNAGNKIGNEFQVNTHIYGDQSRPAVAALSEGGFVVIWQSYFQDGEGEGIYGQKFDKTGNKVGDEFHVNSIIRDDQFNAAVTSLDNNGFFVVWASSVHLNYWSDIHGKIFIGE